MTRSMAVSGLGSGLASRIDSQSLIAKLVALRQKPIANLQTQESGYKSQISTLGNLATQLTALQTAAKDLASNGVLGLSTTTSNTAFTAKPSSAAVAGSYDIQVDTLASAAKWRSGPFGSDDTVAPGTFTITVGEEQYVIDVETGASLGDVASAIRETGAPVSASILNDGDHSYLSLTSIATGYDGDDPRSAMDVDFSSSALYDRGRALDDDAIESEATNASFSVDGLRFARRSNTVADALPGTTLDLQKATKSPETLTLANDKNATQERVQKFVDAYNAAMKLVQQQLAVTNTTDRATTLAGDSTIRGLQQSLRSLTSTMVSGLGTVRSLADLGIKTERDGTLSIDSNTLGNAIAHDPFDVNAVFGDAASGVGKRVADLVNMYTQTSTGLLVIRQDGLNKQIHQVDDQVASMQDQLTKYQDSLTQKFAQMDAMVSNMSNIGNYLAAQSSADKNDK